MAQIDYYLSVVSPYTYMGHAAFLELAERQGASVRIKPVNMGEIFPKTGGLPLAKRAPARQAYRFQELKRWRKKLGIPLNLKPAFFPANDRSASGMVIAADLKNLNSLGLAGAFLHAVWAEDRNVADPDTLISIANNLGLDGNDLFAQSASPEVETTLKANTQQALDVGVFGVPTYALGEEIFWGQDRLEFLEQAVISSK